MTNKSSKSPTGEEREQKNEYIRDQEVKQKGNTGGSKSGLSPGKQENLSNRGYEEDQPHNPVRSSDPTKKDQEKMPAGEPDKSDRVNKNNQ